ncbi:glycosyltransferase-like protein [Plakobranchus ocellatus]|uniref:Glycosyltransferase family 92 protein n=1 Tax=Plakobranchus ocellatus TaxID=259542 RepID=A0AAV4DDW2_9GAST|nr:glycosyltransferase-like protein [Plakobranchus ocellatus]
MMPLRLQTWLLSHLSASVSPRRLFPVFGVIVFVYFVIYLLWTTPASHKALMHQRSHADQHWKLTGQKNYSLNNADKLDVLPEEQFAAHWRGVWVPERNIQVMSAIRDIHHGLSTGEDEEMRLVLPAFLQHSSDRNFFCCLHWSDDWREFIQVPARLDYIDLRYVVELQAATFACIVKRGEVKDFSRLKHVSFTADSCSSNPTLPMGILTPMRRQFEFAVCTKVAYGRLDPQRLLEWFIFMELMGASKVLTFHNNVHNDTMQVFKFFENKGFLELIKFDPRNKGDKSVSFMEQNAQTRQARHDKTLVVRDCQYRLGGYDFVMAIDFDELPVPRRPFRTINWVLQSLSRNLSDAAAFRLDPYLLPPDAQTRKDPLLYHWQFTKGTTIAPYCYKWVFAPARAWMAATHELFPKEKYKTYVIPDEYLHFLHFRSCKSEWHKINCSELSNKLRTEDSLMRFMDRVVYKLRKLPLKDLLPPSVAHSYIQAIKDDRRGTESYQ